VLTLCHMNLNPGNHEKKDYYIHCEPYHGPLLLFGHSSSILSTTAGPKSIGQEIDWDMWCGQTAPRPFNAKLYLPRPHPTGWISYRAYSGGEMTGLINQSIGEPITTVAPGVAPSTTVIRSLAAEVATNNGVLENFGFLVSNDTMMKLKATETGGSGLPDWQSRPEWPAYRGAIDGMPAYASNVLPLTTSGTLTATASYCLAGSWDDLIVMLYGAGPDITVNPVSDPGWINLDATVLVNSAAQRPGECWAFTENLNNAA